MLPADLETDNPRVQLGFFFVENAVFLSKDFIKHAHVEALLLAHIC